MTPHAAAALLLLISLLPLHALAQADENPGSVPPPPPGRSSAVRAELAPAELVAALRKGGYVLYFRHFATNFSQNDEKSRGPEDCANQRNLVDQGREDARAVGRAVRDIRIPVVRVLASPTCRTVETARLVFGTAQPAAAVRGDMAFRAADPRRWAPLRKLFSTAVASGGNLVIASHGNPFHGVAGPPYLQEGEMAVIRPLGSDFEIVARVQANGWDALRAAAK